jgi:hypothetical protein
MQSLTHAIAHVNVERKHNTTSVTSMIHRDNQAVRRVIHKFPCFFFLQMLCFYDTSRQAPGNAYKYEGGANAQGQRNPGNQRRALDGEYH